MGKKKKNNASAKKGAMQNKWVPAAKQEQKRKRKPMPKALQRLILLGVALALVIGAAVAAILIVQKHAGFNYMEANLSRFVKLSPEALEDIKITVRVDKPTEEDVEQNLLALLVQHKYRPDDMVDDPDAVIENGSEVELYYIGYTLSADGKKTYFNGGSNLSVARPDTLVIGSGQSPVYNYEKGLIGIRPSDTEVPTVIKEGMLAEGDVVYVNLKGFHPNGSAIEQYGMPIVLTPALDAVYGEGFYDLLVNSEIGENLTPKTVVLQGGEGNDGDFVYTNIVPLYKTLGGKAHNVQVYFPLDYPETSLQGKTAYFDMYVKSNTAFLLPELNDAFLTNKVGILPEKLSDYEGESLVEKYKSYVRKTLEDEYLQALFTASEESFWTELAEVAKVKRVPAAAMQEVYEEYMMSLDSTYQEYLQSSGYTEDVYPFKTFARDYFRLENGQSYKKKVRELARQTAGEKMIFFYAIKVCGVMPSESELKAEYEKSLLEYAKMNSLLDESYYENETDPEKRKEAYKTYLEEVEKTKVELLKIRGEEYFLESAYYNYGFERLLKLAKITYVGKGHEE